MRVQASNRFCKHGNQGARHDSTHTTLAEGVCAIFGKDATRVRLRALRDCNYLQSRDDIIGSRQRISQNEALEALAALAQLIVSIIERVRVAVAELPESSATLSSATSGCVRQLKYACKTYASASGRIAAAGAAGTQEEERERASRRKWADWSGGSRCLWLWHNCLSNH